MAIIKTGSEWYGARCDCCGAEAFNEANREDVKDAIRNSQWAIVSSGGMRMMDYCPDCRKAMTEALAARKMAMGKR